MEYVDENKLFAETMIKELVSITNLIIEDGFNEYRYAHKSIQEFYAASFIKNLPHEKKELFMLGQVKISISIFYLKTFYFF